MKFNTRALALAAGIVGLGALAGSANAGVRFYIAYGDAQLVTLAQSVQFGGGPRDSAAAIGREIPSDRALRVPKVADNLGFKVQVWMEVLSTVNTTDLTAGGAGFLAVDRANGATSTDTAATYATKALDKKLGFVNTSTPFDLNPSVPGKTASGDGPVAVGYASGGQFYTTVFGSAAATTGASYGAAFSMGFGTGNNMYVHVGDKIKLFDATLINSALANFDIYGDGAGENGISLNSVANATGRANFVLASVKANGNPGVTPRYAVQAVPEPGSILAIAAGVLALAARRRK